MDAHSAMVMAQGGTQEQVRAILEDIDVSALIDVKTKKLLHFAKTVTENSYKIYQGTIQELKDQGCSDGECRLKRSPGDR